MPPKNENGQNQCMYFWHDKKCRYGSNCGYAHTHRLSKGEVKSARASKRDKEEKKRYEGTDKGSTSSSKVNNMLKQAQARNVSLSNENKELKFEQRKSREQVELDSLDAHDDIRELDEHGEDDEDDN